MSSPNRRRIVLVNKPFQVRFAIYMCGWISALCFVYPFIVKSLFDYFFRYAAHDPLGPELDSLFKVKHEVLTLLVLAELSFLTMTFLMCIFVSHRIAGPLHKLRRCFSEFAAGKWKGDLKFRAKDYFQNIADDFNAMVRTIQDRREKDRGKLSEALTQLEKGNVQAAVSILKQIHAEPAAETVSADTKVGSEPAVKEPA